MPLLYFMRHAASEANEQDILASRMDFPLSGKGRADAARIAGEFLERYRIQRIISSPLSRARQTAQPFADASGLTVETDDLLVEQHLGRFSGLTYAQLESEPAYEHRRTERWDWVPDGGGESYRMIAERVKGWFENGGLETGDSPVLIVTHAVTLRLIRAVLEHSLPSYPENIARNGEIWEVDYRGPETPSVIVSHLLGEAGEQSYRA